MSTKYIRLGVPVFILFLLFTAFLFAPHSPIKTNARMRFAPPSRDYPMGTDELGRCVFSRIAYGGRTTLTMVIAAAAGIFVFGTGLGMLTAKKIMKHSFITEALINAATAIPPIAYLIIFIASWGSGIFTTLFALIVSYMLRYIKLAGTQIDIEYDKAYVLCAMSLGASKVRIIVVHILPNIAGLLIRYLCLCSADMILAVTGFSFIGLGLGDSVVDWGSMILDAKNAVLSQPLLILYPMGAVFLAAVSFNVLGNAIVKEEG